jgi:exosortase H (IPTLxxWG-CTERM-specific)
MFRYIAAFFLLLAAGVVVMTRPEVKHIFSEPWGGLLAQISHALIAPWDPTAIRDDNVLTDSDTSFAVAVDAECNGVDIVLLFWAAVLAFPIGWKAKLLGLALGFFGLQALNLVRIISLFYLGQWDREVFTWSHHNVWQGLMMFGAIVLFYGWLKRTSRPLRDEAEHAKPKS